MQHIAFQGEEGSYSHEAVLWYFGEQMTPVPCATFAQVFEKVARGSADAALVPIGNSYAGPVQEVCQLLKDTSLVVAGTFQRPIRHCLQALPGQRLEHITQVMSHPQALMQCDTFLSRLAVELIAVSDTAGSARIIREQELCGVATIASARAAERYQLAILAEDIQSRSNNATCFVILCSAQTLLREGYALFCDLKGARARGWHDQAERLTHSLVLRDQAGDWGTQHAS